MQNIHPWFVHFPIALFVSSLLFSLTALFYKKGELENVAKWIWWLGTLIAVVTVGTGWQASNNVAHSDASHEIMELHETLGWVIFSAAVLFSIWKLKAKPEWEEKARAFTLLFQVVLVSILSYSAHLGGRLVYEFGTGTSLSLTPTEKLSAPPAHDHKAHSHDHSHKHHDHSQKDSPSHSPLERGAPTVSSEQGVLKKYFCPMRCEGEKTYPKPGSCPVCNMRLTLKKSTD